MGQQSQCPLCGGVFVIPVVPGMPVPQPGWAPGFAPLPPGYYPPQGHAAPSGAYPAFPNYPGAAVGSGYPAGAYPDGYAGVPLPGGAMPSGQQPWAGHEQAPPTPYVDFQIQTEPASAVPPAEPAEQAPAAEPPKPEAPPEKQEPQVVRIPCPAGHELQTPMDMVGQDVLCPICSVQFHLRYEDSIEFKEEQAELRRRKAERVNEIALKWSIGAAVTVVLGIAGMMIYLAFSAPAEPSRNEPTAPGTQETTESSNEVPPQNEPSADPERTE